MRTPAPFVLRTVLAVVMTLVLGGGTARAAIVTEFDGQYGVNTSAAVSTDGKTGTAPPLTSSGAKTFYLTGGQESGSTAPSSAYLRESISDLFVDLTNFTDTQNSVALTNPNPPRGFGSDKFFIGSPSVIEGPTIFAEFKLGSGSVLTFDNTNHTGTIQADVTLVDSANNDNSDLSAFNTAGGGVLRLEFQNVNFVPSNDGHLFFPIDPNKPVTVSWRLQATPVPAPAPAVLLLSGACAWGIGRLLRRARAAVASRQP